MKDALVLFAHGSRDPEWARPFERILASLRHACDAREVRLAYLEHMKPSLEETLAELETLGVEAARIVPLFFGLGGHLKQDLPRLAAGSRLRIAIEAPIGEQPEVIEAIAAAIARQAARP